jgi:hypothetical protein
MQRPRGLRGQPVNPHEAGQHAQGWSELYCDAAELGRIFDVGCNDAPIRLVTFKRRNSA